MQVDAAWGQVDGADVGGSDAAGVQAGRVDALALVVVQVELDGRAVDDAAGAAGVIRSVTQAAAGGTQGSRSIALDALGDSLLWTVLEGATDDAGFRKPQLQQSRTLFLWRHPIRIFFQRSNSRTRGGRLISSNYENSYTKLEWECEHGHRWRAGVGRR